MAEHGIEVCCRVKPDNSQRCVLKHNIRNGKHIATLLSNNGSDKEASTGGFEFGFHQILSDTCSQEEAFQKLAVETVDSVLGGFNGTIMAYGQTGAGKSYTITGGEGAAYDQRGIAARAIAHVFAGARRRPDADVRVALSFLEIYNEQMTDLLNLGNAGGEGDPGGTRRRDQPAFYMGQPVGPAKAAGMNLSVVEEPGGGTQVRNLTLAPVAGPEEALGLLFEAQTNRIIASHRLNAQSSRSHLVFTLHVTSRPQGIQGSESTYSKLNLVDLAGSERIFETNSSGILQKEASYINKSLTFLEQVVLALTDSQRAHVPYRQSKLTHVLKDSLGGNCRTTLCACVWPNPEHYHQTLSTLKFAARMAQIRNQPIKNVGGARETSQANIKLQRQVKELKEELALYDALSGRDVASWLPGGGGGGGGAAAAPAARRRAALRRGVGRYLLLGAEEGALEVVCAQQVREVFEIFSELIHDSFKGEEDRSRLKAFVAEQTGFSDDMSGSMEGEAQEAIKGPEGGRNEQELTKTESLDPVASFGSNAGSNYKQPEDHTAQEAGQRHKTQSVSTESPEVMFEQWKAGPGAAENLVFCNLKADIKGKKKQLKFAAGEVNNIKAEIDLIFQKIQEIQGKEDHRDEDPTEVEKGGYQTEEENVLVAQMREKKKLYRAKYEEHSRLKEEVKYLTTQKEQTFRQMVQASQVWGAENGQHQNGHLHSENPEESTTAEHHASYTDLSDKHLYAQAVEQAKMNIALRGTKSPTG